MKRLVASLGALAVAGSVLVVGPLGSAAHAGPRDGGGGITWQYSDSADGYYREPHGGESGGGGGGNEGPATVKYDYGPAYGSVVCPENDDAYACDEYEDPETKITGIHCADSPGPRGLPVFPWIRYERDIENGEPTKWVGEDADCTEPSDEDFVSMQEISTHIDYRVFQPLGDPKVELEPAGRTLVNFPTIVSTNYPEGVGAPAELLSLEDARVRIPINIEAPGPNLTGEIIAEANFEWQFGNGETATGRGRPYEEGVSPKDNPGYYTTGTFTSTGEKSISLTATWTGDVTVETLAPEEIEPVVRETTTTVDVVESRSRLRDGS